MQDKLSRLEAMLKDYDIENIVDEILQDHLGDFVENIPQYEIKANISVNDLYNLL